MKRRFFQIITVLVLALVCVCSCGNQKPTETKSTTAATPFVNEHSIGLTGVGNARELGGYAAVDGKTVKRGAILRTATLSNATDDDIKRLKEVYHLSKVLDLRMSREIESQPDPEIDGVKNILVPIIDENLAAERASKLSEKDLEGIDLNDKIGRLKLALKSGFISNQMYVDFLSGNQGKTGYKQMFEELLSLPEGESLLFHCTQGKDRTGCAAMLILSALGVSEDTIMQDFVLTNTFNAELIESERKMLIEQGYKESELDELMVAMDQVNPQYMQNALNWMKENYGSVTGYITYELGITDEQIKSLMSKYLV
ncbi:MAG: tyrosine-protein phosphatase [Clostridia bacterium]|nr:tyrosine-protein phosphatase [Clostridia bacterium]